MCLRAGAEPSNSVGLQRKQCVYSLMGIRANKHNFGNIVQSLCGFSGRFSVPAIYTATKMVAGVWCACVTFQRHSINTKKTRFSENTNINFVSDTMISK